MLEYSIAPSVGVTILYTAPLPTGNFLKKALFHNLPIADKVAHGKRWNNAWNHLQDVELKLKKIENAKWSLEINVENMFVNLINNISTLIFDIETRLRL